MPNAAIFTTDPDEFCCRNGNFFYDSSLITSVLNGLNVKYIFSSGYPVSVAAAAAVLLDCPLIGHESDFYVICSNAALPNNDLSCKLQYIPISGIAFSPLKRVPLDIVSPSESTYFMRAHLYNPSESILSNLPGISCRLFGILLGDSVTPQLILPHEASEQDIRDKSRICEKRKVKNAIKLAQWIGDVGPFSAMQSVIALIEEPYLQTNISECILQSVTRTQLDVFEASQLLLELECAISSNGFVIQTMSNIFSSMKKRKCLPSFTSSVRLTDSMLKHWPSRMLKAYRRGFVCPLLVSSLYCEGGNFFPCLLDYINDLTSSYLKALCVRYISYGLLYSFELSLGGCGHLAGLRPHLIEIHPVHPSKVKILSITLQEVSLSGVFQITSNFIFDTFGFDSDTHLSHGINGFALCLKLWHKQKALEDDAFNKDAPGDCPLVLAACVCAMAQSFNEDISWIDAFNNYESVVEEIRLETKNLLSQSPSSCSTDDGPYIIHSYVEMQNIYSELVGLNKLVKGLTYCISSCDELEQSNDAFLPSFLVFPSNELFFWLVKYFHVIPVNSRRLKAARCWLPRLIMRSVNGSVQERLRHIVSDLIYMLEHLNRVNVNLPEISKSSVDFPFSQFQTDTRNLFSPQKNLEDIVQQHQKQQGVQDNRYLLLESVCPMSTIPSANPAKEYIHLNATFKTCPANPVTAKIPPIERKSKKSDWIRKPTASFAGGDSPNEFPNGYEAPPNPSSGHKYNKAPGKWTRKNSSSYADRLKQRVNFQ